MKTILTTLLLFGSISAWGHTNKFNTNEKQIMSVWDGSFFYNTISVNEHVHQDNIITVYVHGASMGIGAQMDEDTQAVWASEDLIRFTIRKDECEVFDKEALTLTCDIRKRVYGEITWKLTPVTTQTYTGSIEKLAVEITKDKANVSFEITANDHFKPAVSRLEFGVSNLLIPPFEPLPTPENNPVDSN